MARLSKVLVTLKDDCPLPNELDDFLLKDIPPEPLAAFLGKHGFTSLLKRLDGGRGSPERKTQLNPAKPVTAGAAPTPDGTRQPLPDMPAIDRTAYPCVQTLEDLDQWIERAFAARVVAFDTETSALDALQGVEHAARRRRRPGRRPHGRPGSGGDRAPGWRRPRAW